MKRKGERKFQQHAEGANLLFFLGKRGGGGGGGAEMRGE